MMLQAWVHDLQGLGLVGSLTIVLTTCPGAYVRLNEKLVCAVDHKRQTAGVHVSLARLMLLKELNSSGVNTFQNLVPDTTWAGLTQDYRTHTVHGDVLDYLPEGPQSKVVTLIASQPYSL
eukprot:5563406-Amphidinium_carterae.1